MNFTPNFEQYKIDQAKLEVIPTIKYEFHFKINDCAEKVLKYIELTENEINDLEMVYSLAQDLEKELVSVFITYRSQEILTRDEFLIFATYFLTAAQNGPESSEIKQEILNLTISTQQFNMIVKKVSMPENTRSVIIEGYRKMKDYKNRS